MPAQAARDVLLGVSRAVQRATIYPPGHPSIGVATRPLVDALARVFDTVSTLVLAFTSEGVLVGTHAGDAQLQEASWLGARLAARGVASIEFSGRVPPETAERLVNWLAQPGELVEGDGTPALDGCAITRIDYSRASFREAPVTDDVSPAVALAWRMLCRSLTGEWGIPSDEVLRDPTALARYVGTMLERQEGAGIGEFIERFAGVNSHLAKLSGNTLAIVKERLASFLEALSPEFRDRLLAATPRDSADKLELLAQLVDRLPRPLVIDVVKRLKFERGGSAHQFITLMTKLTVVAAGDEAVAEVLAERCRLEGLPSDPVSLADPAAQQLLDQMLTPREGDVAGVNPEDYQQHLDALGTGRTRPRCRDFVSPQHGDPGDVRVVAHHAAEIALCLLRQGGGDDAGGAVCADRVRQELPAWLADGHLELLAQVASAFQAAVSSGGETLTARQARGGLEFFGTAGFAREIVARLEDADRIDEPVAVLARLGGAKVAQAVLTRLGARPGPEVTRRLGAALGTLEIDLVRTALADLCADTPSFSRAAVAALLASGAPVAVELAEVLVGEADPVVRAGAYRLLLSGRGAPPGEDVLTRILGDDDPRVVEIAIDAVERHEVLAGPRALGAFLDARRPAGVAPLQQRLVRVLAKRPEPAARGVLADALARRRMRFDRSGRLLSRVMSVALERTGGADAAAVVIAWRRSPAGLVSRLLRDVSGAAA